MSSVTIAFYTSDGNLINEGVYVGRLLSRNYVRFDIARVPLAAPNVLHCLQFPKSTTEIEKEKSHAR